MNTVKMVISVGVGGHFFVEEEEYINVQMKSEHRNSINQI